MENIELVDQIKSAYADLGLHNLDRLATLYREDTVFIDPINEIRGREALMAHFESVYQNVISCRFDFDDTRQVMERDQVMLSWTMTYQHKKLSSKKPIEVAGASLLRLDNGILLHRDWFDVGAMVYEHIPLLGSLVRVVKGKLEV